jgi:hypothetical protein
MLSFRPTTIAEQLRGGKNLFQVAQGLHAGQARHGYLDLAASRDV